MFKLIPTVRGGTSNSAIVSRRYDTLEEARAAVKQLMHENNRVTRVAIVVDELPSRVAEFVERS